MDTRYLILIASLVNCRTITEIENRWIKSNCGAELKRPSRSFGGRLLLRDEYPWIARIFTSDSMCSGSLISPRHILTAAHCVHNINDTEVRDRCQNNGDNGFEYPLNNETEFTIYLGNECTYPEDCQKPYHVERVISRMHSLCSLDSDVAVLVLDGDVLVHEATPICLPSEYQKIADSLLLAGAGYDPTSRDSGILRVVKLFYAGRNGEDQRVVVGRNSSSCPGDSGGPLFQKGENDRYTVVGLSSTHLFAKEEDPCKNKHLVQGAWVNHFTDVRRHIGCICSNTVNRPNFKSTGARPAQGDEYPWIARIYYEGWFSCSGSLISPSHVLTAGHCAHIFQKEQLTERCSTGHGYKIIREPDSSGTLIVTPPLRKLSDYEIFLGNECGSTPWKCQRSHQVKRVISNLEDLCNLRDDIAILELDEDVSLDEVPPICLPSENHKISRELLLAGAGLDETLQPGHMRVTKSSLHYYTSHASMIDAITFNSSDCSGDSGGPLLLRETDGRHTIVGVHSAVPTNRNPCEVFKKTLAGTCYSTREWRGKMAMLEK